MTDDDPDKTLGSDIRPPGQSDTLPGSAGGKSAGNPSRTPRAEGTELDLPAAGRTTEGGVPGERSAGIDDTCPPEADAADSARISGNGDSPSTPVLPQSFGRYRVVRLLGEGAMGAVFLARDRDLDRQVAIKVPKFDTSDGSEVIERFYREARAAATLRNSGICPVYDVGEINGIHYLSMAYINGRPLGDFISSEDPRPVRQVVSIIRRLATSLQDAHTQGIVHRDLKPANIMIDERQEPIIMDFGLARRLIVNEGERTQQGEIIGSPAYMSPEQIDDEFGNVGPQADIYSLGVVLYEFLTGHLPFLDKSVTRVLVKILTEDPPPPSSLREDLDPRIEAICLKMMARLMDDRYRSMRQVSQDLKEYLQQVRRSPPHRDRRSPDQSRRRGDSPATRPRQPRPNTGPAPEETLFDQPIPREAAAEEPEEPLRDTDPGLPPVSPVGESTRATGRPGKPGQAVQDAADDDHPTPVSGDGNRATGDDSDGSETRDAGPAEQAPSEQTASDQTVSGGAAVEQPAAAEAAASSAPAASGQDHGTGDPAEAEHSEGATLAGGEVSDSEIRGPTDTFAEHVAPEESESGSAIAPLPQIPLPLIEPGRHLLDAPPGKVQLQLVQDGRVIDGRTMDVPAGSLGRLTINLQLERQSVSGRDFRHDRQHRVARMILGLGGAIHIAFDDSPAGQTREVVRTAELPARPFTICRAKLQNVSRPDPDMIAEILRLETLEDVDFYETRLTAEQARVLASLPLLRRLNLAGRHVTDEILEPITSVSGMESLYLWKCRASDRGIASLGELTNLKHLGIECRNLSDDGLAGLSKLTQLETLGLSGRRVTDRGLEVLSQLYQLESLGLGQTPIHGDGLLALQNLTGLQRLFLNRTHLDNAGLRSLSACQQLETLDLGATRVDSGGIPSLLVLQRLRTLLLYETRVGDQQLEFLTELPELAVLNLNRTRVTEKCLTALGQLKGLQFLHLANTDVSTPALHRLRGSLPDCRIKGGGAPVTDSREMAPDSMFGDLENVDAFDEIREAVGWVLKHGGKLEVATGGEPRVLVPGDVIPDVELTVTGVKLDSARGMHGDGLGLLSQMPELHSLSLADSDVTDSGMLTISGLAQLAELRLSRTAIGNVTLAHLRDLAGQSDSIVDSPFRTEAGQGAVDATMIASMGPGQTHLTGAVLKQVAGHSTLERLHLDHTSVTDDGMELLRTLLFLEELVLDGTAITDRGLALLDSLRSLRRLSVVNCGAVTAEGVAHFRQLLPGCRVER